MKRLFIIATVVVSAGMAQQAVAQSYLTAISYEIGFPLSDTKEFTSGMSWIGFKFDTRRFVQDNASVGLSAALHVFDDKVNDEVASFDGVFDNDRNIDIWGTQYRWINSWPLMVNAFYYLGDRRSQVRPYLGSGVGFFAARRRLDAGLSSVAETTWQFGFSPEIGFLYNMGELNLLLKGTYNYGIKTGDVNALQYVNVGIGFAWTGY